MHSFNLFTSFREDDVSLKPRMNGQICDRRLYCLEQPLKATEQNRNSWSQKGDRQARELLCVRFSICACKRKDKRDVLLDKMIM